MSVYHTPVHHWAQAAVVELRNHNGTLQRMDAQSAVCELTVANAILLSPAVSKVEGGLAVFPSIAVDAPFNTTIILTVTCQRKHALGLESIIPLVHVARVRHLMTTFVDKPDFVFPDRVMPVIKLEAQMDSHASPQLFAPFPALCKIS